MVETTRSVTTVREWQSSQRSHNGGEREMMDAGECYTVAIRVGHDTTVGGGVEGGDEEVAGQGGVEKGSGVVE